MATSQAIVPDQPRGSKYSYVDQIATSEQIPIIRHIIPDDDIPELKSKKLRPVELEKVVKLMTDPHTMQMVDKHVNALQKVAKRYDKGFLMRDLVYICHILNICVDRDTEEDCPYVASTLDLLKLLSMPFIKEHTSDALSYRSIAIETVNQIGYLLRSVSRDVRLQICHTLSDLYCNEALPLEYKDLQPCDLPYMKKVFEESDVANTLITMFQLSQGDMDLMVAIMDLLQKMTQKSKLFAEKVLHSNGAYEICQKFATHDPTGELLFRSVEVLWNLLEWCSSNEVAHQMSHKECIIRMRDAFLYQLSRSFSQYDTQLRNDLLVLCTLVLSANHTAPFLETGFAKQLVLLTTFQEVKSHNPLVKNLKLMRNHEDFEFKKLLINIIVAMSEDPCALPIISDGHVLLALFYYVRPNEVKAKPTAQEWSPAYFEEIQLHAIAALTTLCPKMLSEYMEYNGSTIILLFLEWIIGPADFGGHGNSFHGAGGRGNKRAQMRHCVRLILAMVNVREEAIITEFVDQGAISMLTGILSSAISSKIPDDAIDMEIQYDILFILATLCETDQHRKELFGSDGIDTLSAYLRMDRTKLTSGLGHHRLLLAAIECVWCAVIGCYTSEDYFLEKEGSFLLLDILEDSPRYIQNQVLGCLLDLTDNVKAMAHINQWRGTKILDQTAAHLLCEIWRSEERVVGVPRGEKLQIIDGEHPLMSERQRELGCPPIPSHEPSHSIVEVSDNMRSKIYALFRRIGYVGLEGITVEDNVTLTVIERYLDFKMGEVWAEVEHELEAEGIRPISPDIEALQWIHRCRVDNAQQVAQTQKELLELQYQQEEADEQKYYSEIRDNHRQKEKTLKDFAAFVTRTSNYDELKKSKELQNQSIAASRLHKKYESSKLFHSTDIPNLKATVFCGEMVTVESTPSQIFGGHLEMQKKLKQKNKLAAASKISRQSHRSVELIG